MKTNTQKNKMSSFQQIIQFYKTKYHNHENGLETKPLLYNNVMPNHHYSPRSLCKSTKKQTVRTIRLSSIINSSYEIQQRLNSRMNYFSVKKDYDQIMKGVSDNQLIDRLKNQLIQLPRTVKSTNSKAKIAISEKTSMQIYPQKIKIEGCRFNETQIIKNKQKNEQINLPNLNHRGLRLTRYEKIEETNTVQKMNMRIQNQPLSGWS